MDHFDHAARRAPGALAARLAGAMALFGSLLLTAGAAAEDYFGSESAGDAVIENLMEQTTFNDQSTAGNASISNALSGSTRFNDQSTAGNATLLNRDGGTTFFTGQSSAGNASITSADEGTTYFFDNSSAGTARLIALDSGVIDFAEGTGPAGDNRNSAGSIEGSGTFVLRSTVLSVGSNDLSTEVSGVLVGAADGGLIKLGSGTLTLSGDNSNSLASAILIRGGLINFNSGASLGSGSITLDGGGLQWAVDSATDISGRLSALGGNGGTFDTHGNDVTLAGAIGGAGALTKTGDGLLLLNGANAYSGGTVVAAGTLRQGVAGALPAGTAYSVNGGSLELNGFDLEMSALSGSGGQIATGLATLTVDQSGSSSYAGSIAGSGALIKRGAGRLELSGSNSYAGPTEVQGGSLAVNGALASFSSVQVRTGATLGGTGTVGSVLLDAGGILAPGNSIGTLNVDGDLAFASGSIYQLEADAAGNADRLVVSGLANLAGTVQVLAENGDYAADTRYSILSASGESPLSGQFDGVSANLAFLDPSLTYSSNEVFLTLVRNDIDFASLALTRNQRAFAGAAETLDSDDPVYQTLLNQSAAQAPDSFARLSGDAHASFASALLLDDLGLSRMPLGNLRRNLDSPENALPYWVQVNAGRQRIDGDGNAGQVVQDHQGTLIGGDWPVFADWRLGGALGYGQEQLEVDQRGAKADADSYRYALYGGRELKLSRGTLKLFGGGAYSRHRLDSRRQVELIDADERLAGQYDVTSSQAFGELAWHLALSQPAYVEPFVGLLLIDQQADGFAEDGGAAALSADSQRSSLLSSTLGLRGQQLFQLAQRDLLVNGAFTWRHIDGDLRPERSLRIGDSQPFKVLGTEIPNDSLLVELNLDYALTPNVVLDVDYNGVFSSSSQANTVAFNLRWRM
jgi:autotransporter-associated beta strand protein